MPSRTSDIVDEVITRRRAVRAFLPNPISREEVISILEVAARAPSGTNIQPWRVYILGKPKIDEIYKEIIDSGIKPEHAIWDDYHYYPKRFVEPYLARRRALGTALYDLLGIERRDVKRMREQFNRNFKFFDAPVGIMVSIDRHLEVGSWLDLGMFIQNILISAQSRGLATCPQAAFAPFHRNIRPIIGMPNEEILVCGIAIGYEDKEKVENNLRTERAGGSSWITEVF
jgi:nitroreductase